MKMRELMKIVEGDLLAFKPKRRELRHEIAVMKMAKPSHPWAVFVNGMYLTSFKTEEEANKVAAEKEKEFDRHYERGNQRYQILPLNNAYVLLDRGVRIGVYPDYVTAEYAAEELEPGSTKRMITAWYR